MSPPPPSVVLSLRIVAYSGMSGVFSFGVSFVSSIVTILGFVMDRRRESSLILFFKPLMFTWSI